MEPKNAEILSVVSIRAADVFAPTQGVPSWALMKQAGMGIADAVEQRWSRRKTFILCGPGNNGGDGFVAGRLLADAGWPIQVSLLCNPDALSGDALKAFKYWGGPLAQAPADALADAELIIDAMFGAGLTRPLEGLALDLCNAIHGSAAPIVAIDVPSGLDGDRGRSDGAVVQADLTVTFHRLKPAHVLEPGAALCGETVLVDIGIPEGWREDIDAVGELNGPDLWSNAFTEPDTATHKHRRGRLGVLTGGPASSGAARMAAQAGLRAGAGLVTLLAPKNALQVNAMASTEVMVRGFDDVDAFLRGLDEMRATAAVVGPGAGVGEETRKRVIAALSRTFPLVLDADALTSFAGEPELVFEHLRPGDVLTPHEGEFERLFPELLDRSQNKLEAAREAARRAGVVIVLKGADTIVASPDGRARVNRRAAPALATAGSGDVLAGMIGALLAQGHDAFDAASAANWLHGDCAIHHGPGLVARDLIAAIPEALTRLCEQRARGAALQRLK